MDPDVARWVLDFLLRQAIDDSTFTRLLTTLVPLSNTDNNIKKLLLLKKIDSDISNGSISENVLGLLEQIGELDYGSNVEISDSMKRVYCVVAVHCTVKFLEEDVMGYLEAVKKIWRTKIACMLKSEDVGLVSDELISWKDAIDTSVWDDSVCKDLLNKWKELDVIEIVRVYVKETREMMGPSFLEEVAETMSGDALREVFGFDKEGCAIPPSETTRVGTPVVEIPSSPEIRRVEEEQPTRRSLRLILKTTFKFKNTQDDPVDLDKD